MLLSKPRGVDFFSFIYVYIYIYIHREFIVSPVGIYHPVLNLILSAVIFRYSALSTLFPSLFPIRRKFLPNEFLA